MIKTNMIKTNKIYFQIINELFGIDPNTKIVDDCPTLTVLEAKAIDKYTKRKFVIEKECGRVVISKYYNGEHIFEGDFLVKDIEEFKILLKLILHTRDYNEVLNDL